MVARALIMVLTAGCGRIAFDDAVLALGDASMRDTGVGDGPIGDTGVGDGPIGGDDAPPAPLTVFRSSVIFAPAFGGLAGADAQCQALAAAEGLAGTFRAILSDSTMDARDRLVISGPIYDTTSTLIAMNAGELWSGGIRAPIWHDERGLPQSGNVWTGTNADGIRDADGFTSYCADWTSATGTAEIGSTNSTDPRWISLYGTGQTTNPCSAADLALYCLQQR